MQWNLTQDGGLWILAPDSVKQIGCIHTCQGLEAAYIGVIVGPDLVVRNGKVKTLPAMRSRQDQTLMTRGMKGCYVYCMDQKTRDWFRGRLLGR
jgi:DUF2075 family protein